jgi:peptidoglycan/xylan/chitin deacetylase (PgdA/CDA1 family)
MVTKPLRTALRQTLRQVKHRLQPGALILMYHRVTEVDADPWALSVTPDHFAEHLEILRRRTRPVSLQHLTQNLGNRQSLNHSVVITFDDGYADNLYHAKPLLEKFDIPATVFITTGNIGQQQEFWWDELDRLVFQSQNLPHGLKLQVQNQIYEWKVNEPAHDSDSNHHSSNSWQPEKTSVLMNRDQLYHSLYQVLRKLSILEREQALREIERWANVSAEGRLTHRSLSFQEVLDLSQGDLIEVGAHTVTHPFLSELSLASQRFEIQQSKAALEELLNRPVTSFSYPNGDYTLATLSLVQEIGFSQSCCSISDQVQPHSNPFLLPRLVVEDSDGETFSRWLSGWL